MIVYFSTNKTPRFHNKCFALSLALKMRFLETRKCSIESDYYIINVFGKVWFRIIMFIERLCTQTYCSKLIFKPDGPSFSCMCDVLKFSTYTFTFSKEKGNKEDLFSACLMRLLYALYKESSK